MKLYDVLFWSEESFGGPPDCVVSGVRAACRHDAKCDAEEILRNDKKKWSWRWWDTRDLGVITK